MLKHKHKQKMAYQHPSFALGNFIMITPAIRRQSEKQHKPVNVYFAKQYVKECFKECSFINPVSKLRDQVFVSSNMVNRNMPDYQYSFKKAHKEIWESKYHTYVDSPSEYDFSNQKYMVVLNGLAGAAWRKKKETPEHIHRLIKQHSNLPIWFTGSKSDLVNNSPWMAEVGDVVELDNIRKALAIIRDAQLVVANDTGLAHAAGAMNKKLLVLWKDTPFIKNQNPGINTQYAMKHEWEEQVINFLKEV